MAPSTKRVMDPVGAGDDAADASLGFQSEDRGEGFVGAIDMTGVDAGKSQLGACARFIAERPIFGATVLELVERRQRLRLRPLLLAVEVHEGSGGVVALFGCREREQSADRVEFVRTVCGSAI